MLNGGDNYRGNIKGALRTCDVKKLNPNYSPDEEDLAFTGWPVPLSASSMNINKRTLIGEDWESLSPGKRVTENVIESCCQLIQTEHSKRVSDQTLHDGPVYIFDPFFATLVVMAREGDIGAETKALKFVKAEMLFAGKILIPIVSCDHWVLLASSSPGPM